MHFNAKDCPSSNKVSLALMENMTLYKTTHNTGNNRYHFSYTVCRYVQSTPSWRVGYEIEALLCTWLKTFAKQFGVQVLKSKLYVPRKQLISPIDVHSCYDKYTRQSLNIITPFGSENAQST